MLISKNATFDGAQWQPYASKLKWYVKKKVKQRYISNTVIEPEMNR